MANVRLATLTRNAMLDALNARLNLGSGPALVKIYSGTQPANANTGLSGNTLLATLTCSDPAAPSASGATLTLDAITRDTSADASGTATWARVTDSDGNTVFDCDVGGTAEETTGTIQLNTSTLVAGGPVELASFTLTIPAT